MLLRRSWKRSTKVTTATIIMVSSSSLCVFHDPKSSILFTFPQALFGLLMLSSKCVQEVFHDIAFLHQTQCMCQVPCCPLQTWNQGSSASHCVHQGCWHSSIHLSVIQQQQSMRLSELHRKAQLWRGIVSVALIEGRNLIPMDPNGLSDPYVKFRLGNQKYKSKVCNV